MKTVDIEMRLQNTAKPDCTVTVRAYPVPDTDTWYVVNVIDANSSLCWFGHRGWMLMHDGLRARTFRRLKDGIAAGQLAAMLWDKPGLPEPGSGLYGQVSNVIRNAAGGVL